MIQFICHQGWEEGSNSYRLRLFTGLSSDLSGIHRALSSSPNLRGRALYLDFRGDFHAPLLVNTIHLFSGRFLRIAFFDPLPGNYRILFDARSTPVSTDAAVPLRHIDSIQWTESYALGLQYVASGAR